MRRLDIPTDPRREGQGFVATFGLERRYNEFKVSDSSSTPEKASEISSSKSSSEKSPPEESSPDQDSQSGPQKRSRACASTSSGRRRKLDESGSLPAQSEESKSNSPVSVPTLFIRSSSRQDFLKLSWNNTSFSKLIRHCFANSTSSGI